MKNQNTPFGAKLNLRGRMRQGGVRTLNYFNTSGKQNLVIIIATIALFVIFTLINSNFAGKSNLLLMSKSLVPYAILSLGVTFAIATGGIDLSIGTICVGAPVLAGAICGTGVSQDEGTLWLTIPIILIVSLGFGLLNGVLIAKCKLAPFIATLGTMLLSRGITSVLAQYLTQKTSAIKFPTSGWFQKIFVSYNDFPIGILWVIGLAIICMIVMFKTKIGRYILAIGSNEEAARLSGIKVDRYKIIAYAICGLFAGIAALFWTAANPSLTLASGNGMELDAIAGVYIGGTSTTGGAASVMGSVFGALILVVIRQGLNFALTTFHINLSSTFITYAVTGVIVVGAVLLDVLKKKSAAKVKIESDAQKRKRQIKETIAALRVEQDYALSAKGVPEADERAKEIPEEIYELKAEYKSLK